MSKKDEKIKRLFDKGMTDPRLIARKLGYEGGAMVAGIARVREDMQRLGLVDKALPSYDKRSKIEI